MPTTPPERIFTIPNQLTFARFFLALGLFVLIHYELWDWCLLVFAVAAFTDWLDGYLARVLKQGSALGRQLDPLIDKVLNLGCFVFLLPLGTREGWLVPWMVVLLVSRELIITGLRSWLESLGAKFGADWLGKLKMIFQCAALVAIFLALQAPFWFASWTGSLIVVRDVLIWTMLALTLLSGLQYLAKAAVLWQPGESTAEGERGASAP
jgi:CDP-diacylglycerol--glycerol-3-phosphate 3-phosphatidyltransferase